MAKIACCHNCAYAYWDRDHTVECMSLGVMNWPACANHPESLGRMQRVPGRGICVNYRPRLATPEGEVRQIPLGDGFYAYVDAADYGWLSQWTWHLHAGYAMRLEKRKQVYMHREIMQPPKGRIVDHKNRNRLDNTRANLRNCTHAENARNRTKRRGTSSRFRGVSRHKNCDKYYAAVYDHGKQLFLGLFAEEIDAARAYDSKAVELFGEFARLNFPEEWPAQRRAEVHAVGAGPRDCPVPDARRGRGGKKAGKKEGKKVGRKGGKTGGRPRPRVTGYKPRTTSARTALRKS